MDSSESMVLAKYILVAAQKDKAIELRKKLDDFAERFRTDVLLDLRVEQGLVSVPILIVQVVWFVVPVAIANDVKSIHAGVANIQGRLSVIPG